MNITKKTLAAATITVTAVGGLGLIAPSANAAPSATKAFSKTFQQTCQQVGPFGQRDLGAKVSGVAPTTAKKGAPVKVTGGKITTTVPGDLNTAAAATGADHQTVTFSVVNINSTLLTPAVKDTLPKNITTPKVAIVAGKPSMFTIALPAATLKAGTKAGNATLKTGVVKATFQLYKAGAKLGGPQTVSCGAENVLLTTIKIS